MVIMKREPTPIPTYIPEKPLDLPLFIEKKAYQCATGKIYPLPCADRLGTTLTSKTYDMVTLSNEYITVELLPELGGKIHGATQNSNGYEFIYKNVCIKPALIGLAGLWVSGGVEFNWPQHHRPTTFMPTEATLQENPDGSKTCWMGEAEPFHRMRGTVGITVYPGSSLVEAKAVVHNRTDKPLPFMWWNNLAVRVHEQYKASFPEDVEWGSDHDRRAITPFPVADRIYEVPLPPNTDVTWYKSVKRPASIMVLRGQSDMDFLSGYDFAADAGTVTVSDHHYSTGKKMFTWGDDDFGHAWCANLTEGGDRYIELMTGVYTDNQPDFTYIMPGETKTFTTVWYPVREIGEVKNATREAAVSLTLADGNIHFGAITTSPRQQACLQLLVKGEPVFQEICNPDPDHSIVRTVPAPEGTCREDLCVRLLSSSGVTLVSYQPKKRGEKPAPNPRTIPPRPRDVASADQLYYYGAHLEQYKHHTYLPEDYYLEAIRRDPGDMRCNHAMGCLMMEKGDYDAARMYLDTAIARLKMRNDNPADSEPLYQMGRLELLCGNYDAAYDRFAAASWQFAWRSACLYEMGCIACRRGDRALSIRHLEDCLETNASHFAARSLLGYLTGSREQLLAVLKRSVQDTFARYALWLLDGTPVSDFIRSRPQDVVDAALDFLRAGLTQEALQILDTCTAEDKMIRLYRAFLGGAQPEVCDLTLCFPNRLEDIPVLRSFPGDWQAQYLLGCLYYDRMHYSEAVKAWEESARLYPDYAYTWRNLAQAKFDHCGDPATARACLEKALLLAPDNARLVFELQQLYKYSNMPAEERLAFLEAHLPLVLYRSDCTQELVALYIQLGQYDTVRKLLREHRFSIFEGGEGRLTRMHCWLYTILGVQETDGEKAAELFRTAAISPENYGEGRHHRAQTCNLDYYAGLLLEAQGDPENAKLRWEAAAAQTAQITDLNYFAGKALEKLGRASEAAALFRAMQNHADAALRDADLYGYFGGAAGMPMPYESDILRRNRVPALLIKALAHLGLGQPTQSREALAQLLQEDPYGTPLAFYRTLNIL